MTTLAVPAGEVNIGANALWDKWAELTWGYRKSMALKAVLDLRIPDILAKAGGQLTVNEIASNLPSQTVSIDYLARIMSYLTVSELFTELPDASGAIVDDGQRRFGLTELSSLLLEEERAGPQLSLIDETRMALTKLGMAPWPYLSDAVLSGTEPFQLVHGKKFWEFLEGQPEVASTFNKMMAAESIRVMSSVLKVYKGFKGLKQLVDVAGGLGASLTGIIKVYPDISGINFDQPSVIAKASKIPGITHVSGDMFKSVPEGDAIFMKNIMHDWGDEECIQILQNCYKSLPHGGKVILVDTVLPDPKNPGLREYAMDLQMLAYTSGRERTAPQWHRLLKAAGFQRLEIISCPPTAKSIIEGHKS